METSTFPEQLKCADVKPVFKKGIRTAKKNYRLINNRPNVSTIDLMYQKFMKGAKELAEDFQALFSKYECGFRKGYNIINALLPIIEKLIKSLDDGGVFGALLTNLSKAFDWLPHELVIAKLHVYRKDTPSLKLLYSNSTMSW